MKKPALQVCTWINNLPALREDMLLRFKGTPLEVKWDMLIASHHAKYGEGTPKQEQPKAEMVIPHPDFSFDPPEKFGTIELEACNLDDIRAKQCPDYQSG